METEKVAVDEERVLTKNNGEVTRYRTHEKNPSKQKNIQCKVVWMNTYIIKTGIVDSI